MASPATDVFLSYKAEDRARLDPLVKALEAEGFSVWWDAHIGGGTNWHEDIERHLDAAKCVLVAWSKRSVGRDGQFVRDEARRAQRRDAYLPVCLDAVDPPLGFGEIQVLSLKGWKGNRSDPRFQAVADAVRGHVSGEEVARPPVHFDGPRVSRRAAIGGSAGIAALTVAGGGWLLLKPSAVNAKRIAVMPFDNLSGDPRQAYFAEGIAEELRGALSRAGLEVIGRASSRAAQDMDAKSAAAELGVANILTGSVRRSPKMVRISAQLVRGSDGVQRWAQSYDRTPGDEIKIQMDIASSVAQALSLALGQAGQAALRLGGTLNTAAQDLFMRSRERARTASGAEEMRDSVLLAERAIAKDPNYADAYRLKSQNLESYTALYATTAADRSEGLARAEAAARHALALAPGLGTAYAGLAFIEADRLNFSKALQYSERGFARSPDNLSVLSQVSQFELLFGDAQKALEISDRKLALDPLDARTYSERALMLSVLGRSTEALQAARKALQLAPRDVLANNLIGDCLLLMNRVDEARAQYAKTPAENPGRLTGEALVAARTHDRARMEEIVARMRKLFGAGAAYQYGEIYAQAGDADRAFAELDTAVRMNDPGLVALRSDSFMKPIKADPRFKALLKRLNFPNLS